MKVEELVVLGGADLADALKTARRELFELHFKLAVGQLDNHREIRSARKDIARIMTVIRQRELGIGPELPAEDEDAPEVEAATAEAAEAADEGDEAEEAEETVAEARAEPAEIEAREADSTQATAEAEPEPEPEAPKKARRRAPAKEDA
jgi:large subunit ribosomal protein L29